MLRKIDDWLGPIPFLVPMQSSVLMGWLLVLTIFPVLLQRQPGSSDLGPEVYLSHCLLWHLTVSEPIPIRPSLLLVLIIFPDHIFF